MSPRFRSKTRRRARGALSFISVQLDDFDSAAGLVVADQASDDPMRQMGSAAGIAWFIMSSGDPAGALEQVAAAQALLLAVEDGDVIARFQGAGWMELITAWAHAQLGDFESCIEHCDAARQAHERVEMPTMYSSQALHAEALACAELGAFDRALGTADELDQMESIYSRADDARIVVHLLRGDAEAALPYLKAQALDAATGRLSRAANDTMLFLALLAEHDDPDLAVRRLMAVEHTRTPSTIACSIALAERLGVRDAFDETRALGRVDRTASGRRAIEVLRGELVDLG